MRRSDGVFSTKNVWYTTEELYFPEKEFGGTPWTAGDEYSKWDPQVRQPTPPHRNCHVLHAER